MIIGRVAVALPSKVAMLPPTSGTRRRWPVAFSIVCFTR
jgi:hypothetical protein